MSQVSACAWVYPKAASVGSIIYKGNSVYRLRFESSQKLSLALRTDDQSWGYVINPGNTVLDLNAWSFVCFTYNSGLAKLYVDQQTTINI